ncbi:MAG: flagellar hook assembly protein FlgD [Betaproteobacteria bacterium]|nr:flagellar hook assembly protein FlgD [Betaproteobacteria bacterium]
MSTVQSTSSPSEIFASLNASASANSTSASTTQESQDRFLKLLVTQLKNQDPLNPMDNAQVTTQLAQINTVTGIDKLNSTLGTLLGAYSDSQAMQAAGLIGKTVLVPGTGLALANGEAYGGVKLAAPAEQVTVSILDSKGNVVQTQNLGAHGTGLLDFSWDGKTAAGTIAPPGTYKFKVEASAGGAAVTAEALQIGTVSALVRGKSGFLLDLGALGTVDFKDVQQIL